jgi:hypothetical protein
VIGKAAIGLMLFPLWVVFMVVVYPIVWIGLRGWGLATRDHQPLDRWIAMWER